MEGDELIRVVILSRTSRTPRVEVWDALTSAARLSKWFLPVEGDLREGGHYSLQGNASGSIRLCRPPERLAITWENAGEVSFVSIELSEDAGTTELRLEHVNCLNEPMWTQFGPGAVGVGWELGLLGLSFTLEAGFEMQLEERMQWPQSEAGKALIAAGTCAWSDAAVVSGEDPEMAKRAAEATRAFYTGE